MRSLNLVVVVRLCVERLCVGNGFEIGGMRLGWNEAVPRKKVL